MNLIMLSEPILKCFHTSLPLNRFDDDIFALRLALNAKMSSSKQQSSMQQKKL